MVILSRKCHDILPRTSAYQADDIFFVDIGPIYGDVEGDAGDTFVVGGDPDHHRAKADVRAVWDEVRDVWAKGGVTGRELYDRAIDAYTQLLTDQADQLTPTQKVTIQRRLAQAYQQVGDGANGGEWRGHHRGT